MSTPEKIYLTSDENNAFVFTQKRTDNMGIEYVRTDAFIKKARKWFEQQPETHDANGVRVYGDEDFEDFRKYMKGE